MKPFLALVAIIAVATPGTASAGPAPTTSPNGSSATLDPSSTGAVDTSGNTAAPTTSSSPSTGEPVTTPVAAADKLLVPYSVRSFNLPTKDIEVNASLPVFGFSGGETATLLGLGFGVGVIPRLELGGNYAFLVSPDVGDSVGLLSGYGKYELIHDPAVSASLGFAVLYSPSAKSTVLAAGAAARYRIDRTFSIYTGTGGVPFCGTCLRFLGPVSGQVLLAFEDGSAEAVISLPVGVGIQSSDAIYLFAETSLATFAIASGGSTSLWEFVDYFGVNVGGWFTASRMVELGLSFGDDLKHPGDVFVFEASGRVRI